MKLSEQDQMLRLELIARLQTIDNPDILLQVRDILYPGDARPDFWESLSAQQKAMTRKGLAELKAGKGIPAEQVLRNLKQ